MAKVLMVGIDPADVDFSDPSLPPGVTAEIIRKGIVKGEEDLRGAGHDVGTLYIPTDPAGLGGLAERLARDPVDCVLIGGGVRVPPRNLPLFEAVLNVIARAPSRALVALVDRPDEAGKAVARVLG
jgi:hypothetical protein